MAIRPILFNTPMVQAILNYRKTVTRRVIKPQPRCDAPRDCDCTVWNYGKLDAICDEGCLNFVTKEPPFMRGDILYVRETFTIWEGKYEYKADVLDGYGPFCANCSEKNCSGECNDILRWRPSIHMPREAARIWLRVTDVRVERLQDITEKDAQREGIQYDDCPSGYTWMPETDMHNCYTTRKGAFSALWDFTIKKSDLGIYGWEANPYVFVIEFERCEKPGE